MFVEKSRMTMSAAISSTICIVLEYFLFKSRFALFGTSDLGIDLGSAISALIIAPHMLFFALACIFTWVGYASDVRGLTLTGGILHAVALLYGLQNWYMVILPLVLCFMGYSEQKELRELADMRQKDPEACKEFMAAESEAERVAPKASSDGSYSGIFEKLLQIFTIGLAICAVVIIAMIVYYSC